MADVVTEKVIINGHEYDVIQGTYHIVATLGLACDGYLDIDSDSVDENELLCYRTLSNTGRTLKPLADRVF